jgi:ubiquinol-cytochrome c reductase cytochrome b subunit
MFGALLIIMLLPITDIGKNKGLQFRILGKLNFYIFVFNFLTLLVLGAKHVEYPFIEFGQISTFLYFSYFLFIIPTISLIENTLMDLDFIYNGNK